MGIGMDTRLDATQSIPAVSDADLMATQGGETGGLPHSYADHCEDVTQEIFIGGSLSE